MCDHIRVNLTHLYLSGRVAARCKICNLHYSGSNVADAPGWVQNAVHDYEMSQILIKDDRTLAIENRERRMRDLLDAVNDYEKALVLDP